MAENLLEKSMALGYVDESGEITPEGYTAIRWQDQGLLDSNFDPTPKGRAWAMTPREALEDPDAYRIRHKEGWDAPDGGLLTRVGEGVKATVGMLGDAITGVIQDPEIAGPFSKEWWTDERDEANARRAAALRSASIASNFWVTGGKDLILKGFRDEDEEIEARRIRELSETEVREMDLAKATSEIIGPLAEIGGIYEAVDEAVKNLPPEKLEELTKQGDAIGEFVNPGDLILDTLTAKLGSTLMRGGRATLTGYKAGRVGKMIEHAEILRRAEVEKGLMARKAEIAERQLAKANRAGDGATANKMAGILARSREGVAEIDRKIAESSRVVERLGRDSAVKAGVDRVRNTLASMRSGALVGVGNGVERAGKRLVDADNRVKGFLAKNLGEEQVGAFSGAGKALAIASPIFAPAAAPVAGAAALLSSGRMIESAGRFFRTIGEETLKARGTVPFWRAVGNAADSLPHVAHMIDLPSRVAGKAGRVTRAAVGAGAVNAGVESLFAGGTDSLPESFGSGLVFGAVGALHGATVPGKRAEFRAAQMADMANFREMLGGDQLALFDSMSPATRKALGTYAAIFPSINWRLMEGGASSYDPGTNTVAINAKSKVALEPLIAHEVSHYLTEMGLADGVIRRLVGAPELGIGGVLRAKDGTLDPHFKSFLDGYNERMKAAGKQPIPVDRAALEYFAEQGAVQLMAGLESGSLQAQARRTAPGRLFRAMMSELIDNAPLAKRFARHTGTLFSEDGKPVSGTGLVADGVRIDAMTSKMLDRLLDRQAGARSVEGQAKADSKKRIGPSEYLKDRPLNDQLWSTWKTDADGNVLYDSDGNPEMLTKAEELERGNVGARLVELIREKQNADPSYFIPEGSFEVFDDGTARGAYLPPEFVAALGEQGVLNRKQVATLRGINAAAKRGKGEVFAMIYQPALVTSTKTGKKRYKSIAPTFRQEVPYAFEVTKKGNLIIRTMSLTKLVDNVRKSAKTERGKRLYGGDEAAIHADLQVYLDNHRKGLPNADDPRIGTEKRDFLNTIFGLMNKDQRNANPLFENAKRPEADAVVRSRRLDRINETTIAKGQGLYPFDYPSALKNFLPEPVASRLNPFLIPAQ